MHYTHSISLLVLWAAYSTTLSEPVTHKKLKSKRYTFADTVDAPTDYDYHNGWYCHYGEPPEPPKTVFGNMITAVAGSATTTVGALFATIGYYLVKDALCKSSLNTNELPLESAIDGFGGIIFGSFGIMFALIGLHTIKTSIMRIYNIANDLPLPESTY